MRIILLKRSKQLTIIFTVLFLLGIISLIVIGYCRELKYLSVLASSAEIDKYEVRSQLLMRATDEIGVCSPEAAVEVWANGLKMRSAALQYSVMGKDLKDKYARQLEKSSPNWVTGISSPWVDSFEIIRTEKLDESCYIFELRFYTKTSTGPAGEYDALLTIGQDAGFWRITNIAIDNELYVYTRFNP